VTIFGVKLKVVVWPAIGFPAGEVFTLLIVKSPAVTTLLDIEAFDPPVPVATRLKPPMVCPRTGKVIDPELPGPPPGTLHWTDGPAITVQPIGGGGGSRLIVSEWVWLSLQPPY
jgi:hypothetical protein